MFQEPLGKLVADHLRSHIREYLDVIDKFIGSESVPLLVPKMIETASVVGGMIDSFDQILPQYGIDFLGKIRSEDDISLFTWEYGGQINGLVHAGDQQSADRLIKRHGAAVEYFIKKHQFMHQEKTDDYSVLELVFAGIDFSGAEDLGEHDGHSVWLAGFSINFSLFTSEEGPDDHATP